MSVTQEELIDRVCEAPNVRSLTLTVKDIRDGAPELDEIVYAELDEAQALVFDNMAERAYVVIEVKK